MNIKTEEIKRARPRSISWNDEDWDELIKVADLLGMNKSHLLRVLFKNSKDKMFSQIREINSQKI